MKKDNQNKTSLEEEKLTLEIEELKEKISSSKKSKTWDDYVKPIVPILVTLLIAIGGWWITSVFNKSQLTITKEKNKTDKEIAQINASLSFIELMNEIPDSSLLLRQQTKTVIAPVLPPETSFFIATEELPDNPYVLEVLMRTYEDDFWKYLLPYLETYPLFLKYDPRRVPHKDLILFAFLDERQILDEFFDFAITSEASSKTRIFSLINYFDYIYSKEELIHSPYGNASLKYIIQNILSNDLSKELRHDLLIAAALVLDYYQDEGFGYYTEKAAICFWDNMNLEIGEIPKEGSIEDLTYLHRFRQKDFEPYRLYELPAIRNLSESLYSELSKIKFKNIEVERINTMLYSYVGNQGVVPFLSPEHSFLLLKKILISLDTESRRKEFSMLLGSLSGHHIYRHIAKDETKGKMIAVELISWYSSYFRDDWYIPKFFAEVSIEHPELKDQIDEKWGVGIE